MTDAIQLSHDPLKPYHFSNENFLLYDVIFEQSSRKLKKESSIENFRDIMTETELQRFARLQRHDTSLIELGFDFDARKVELIKYNKELIRRSEKQLTA